MMNLRLSVKSKILMTVLSVVLMFALFILFYFPARQERYLLENYNEEIENFAKTVALGVKIALTEQNFEGVETAIDFVREDSRLQFVSLIQTDTLWDANGKSYEVGKTVFKTFPENVEVDAEANSSEYFIIKSAPFSSPIMSGEIMLSFSTAEIIESRSQIRFTSILASLIVFVIGLLIGYLLARNISIPVLALRDAANRVGEGDLTQSVKSKSRDEIGELGIAFNKMVKDLSIEAALEKIRSKTMAMHRSDELPNVVSIFFDQLNHLGFESKMCSIVIQGKSSNTAEHWIPGNEQATSPQHYIIPQFEHPFHKQFGDLWLEGPTYAVLELSGELKKSFDEILFTRTDFGSLSESTKEMMMKIEHAMISTAFMEHGSVMSTGLEPLSDENATILQRFAKVFEQTYTRFLDLKKVELQAREKMKQASLDRLRGEIASMRTKEDLPRITPLIWEELTTLEVPFFRCGVFIVDEIQSTIQSYLSTPDGHSLGVFNMPYDTDNISKKLVDHWRDRKVYTEHWNKNQFLKWMQNMIDKGHIQDSKTYQGAVSPPESLDLHFVPFKQGMLYVGNTSLLSEDELYLVKSLAEAFSIAYSRYQDFKQLEEAKNQVEKALVELKETQSQLIQSEKMASLGELTAGIAHEIQNPLNFVNNFSELSVDLMDEMDEEMAKGNNNEVNAITKDLKQNLSKINHHGKRASSIVKGMLEHSRTGNKQKEMTDINILADEYLRLTYHGLRAKDKTFQVDFKTELDESLPKINVIYQDIGRVFLNIMNNAFYAVSKKTKELGNDFKPKVTVSTKKMSDSVEISVRDNGNGIPAKLIDRIYQPFFTTKPTGQGTGLGLSLSYDIITKGHNGELNVKTQEGEGTEFTIVLPQ